MSKADTTKVPEPTVAPRRNGGATLLTLPWVTTPMIVVVFVVLWDRMVVWFDVSRFILPRPVVVYQSLVELVQQPWFYTHLRITVTEIVVGFMIACSVAISLGILIGKSPTLEQILNPLIIALQVTPKVALMPLILVLLGFGISSKIAIAAILSFFPVLKNTVLGVRSIPAGQSELFKVLNATPSQRVRLLEMPFVLPYILTGVETGIVFAVTGAIVGEYLAGQWGLGALVVISMNTLQVPRLFATVIVLATLGFSFYIFLASLRRWLVPWHEASGPPAAA